MSNRYFIFDFDGVVADTEDVFAKFDCSIINEYLPRAGSGYKVPYDIMRGLAGIPGEEKFLTIFKNLDIDPTPFQQEFALDRTERRKLLFETHPVTVGKNLREFLKKIDGRFALATNKQAHTLQHDMKIIGLDTLFPIIVSADPPLRRKPEPDIIIEAMKRLNCQSEDCIYIGDNVADIEAALAADIIPIGFVIDSIIDKKSHMAQLKNAGASMVIDDFYDLKIVS